MNTISRLPNKYCDRHIVELVWHFRHLVCNTQNGCLTLQSGNKGV